MALSKIFVAPKNGQGGVKKSNFFQKKYSKDGKNKFWDLWDHNCTKSIFLENHWTGFGQTEMGGGGRGIVPWSCPLRHTFC